MSSDKDSRKLCLGFLQNVIIFFFLDFFSQLQNLSETYTNRLAIN